MPHLIGICRRQLMHLCVALAAPVILCGCTGFPTESEQAARRDVAAAAGQYRPQDAKPPLPVLTAGSDLADLMRYALLNNPKVESAYREWAASVEAITTARSLPDPMLTFSAEISRGVMALTPAIMTDPMSNWPGPGKIPLRAESAYQESQRRRAAFENEMLSTALAIKRAYYQMWVVDQQVRWTREMLAVVEDMEKLARQRLAVGQVTQQDALRAQMEQDQLQNMLASLEDSRKPVDARLRSALGVRPEAALTPLTFRLSPSAADFTERSLLDVAFVRNPRLREMRSEVQQAIALYQLAEKSSVPDYSFGVGANLKMTPVPIMPTAGITLPIWRDKIAAEIARGRADLQAAQARLRNEELELAVRFAETAFLWREADRNVALYARQLLPKAQAALETARAGYTGGASSFLDVLEAERRLLEYRLNLASATGQREMALAEMSLAILGRWPGGVQPVLPAQAPAATEKTHSPSRAGGDR